jgi:hypothetical protein
MSVSSREPSWAWQTGQLKAPVDAVHLVEHRRQVHANDGEDDHDARHPGGLAVKELLLVLDPSGDKGEPRDEDKLPEKGAREGAQRHVIVALEQGADVENDLDDRAKRRAQDRADRKRGLRGQPRDGRPDVVRERDRRQQRERKQDRGVLLLKLVRGAPPEADDNHDKGHHVDQGHVHAAHRVLEVRRARGVVVVEHDLGPDGRDVAAHAQPQRARKEHAHPEQVDLGHRDHHHREPAERRAKRIAEKQDR